MNNERIGDPRYAYGPPATQPGDATTRADEWTEQLARALFLHTYPGSAAWDAPKDASAGPWHDMARAVLPIIAAAQEAAVKAALDGAEVDSQCVFWHGRMQTMTRLVLPWREVTE